jgi:hypothetical protein
MEITLQDHIKYIAQLIERYGVEFDYFSWSKIKEALATRCPNLVEDKDKVWKGCISQAEYDAWQTLKVDVTNRSKLPTLDEVKRHVSREMWRGAFKTDSMSIVELAYDFILQQLSSDLRKD